MLGVLFAISPIPNLILYLLVVSFLMDSRVWWSLMLLVMIATSPTHSRHSKLTSLFLCLAMFISLVISYMRVAYCVTASTPPCLMLLFMAMGLVLPCLVRIVAVRFWFSNFSLFVMF